MDLFIEYNGKILLNKNKTHNITYVDHYMLIQTFNN